MIDLKDFRHLHFTGLKGVGMTALALCFKDMDKLISGSDTDEEFVTDAILRKSGISVGVGFLKARIEKEKPDLLIYTAAHQGEENPEVKAAKQAGIPVLTYAETLGEFMKQKRGISVCGVGGKSTVSAMIATVLTKAKLDPAFAVGVGNIPAVGVPGKWGRGEWFVAEADEYTTSPQDETPKMIYQYPEIIVLPNLEFDHPDVYPDFAATQKAFLQFIHQLPQKGVLVAGIDNLHVARLIPRVKRTVITYGFSDEADGQVKTTKLVDQVQKFIVKHNSKTIFLKLPVPGRFNAANATAALVVAERLGVPYKEIVTGLKQFTGTKRRFEKIAAVGSTLLYDDYAHHPLEIKATLKAARKWLPGKKILAIFQPHTYSRTKALFSEFTKSFEDADEVILTDIYASARETDDLGMSGEKLTQATRKYHREVQFCSNKAAVIECLGKKDLKQTAIFTLGAGDIFLWHKDIKKTVPRKE